MRLPLFCEQSGAIPLVLVGLTAGRQRSRQLDEILVDFQNSLPIGLLGFSQRLIVLSQCNQCISVGFFE